LSIVEVVEAVVESHTLLLPPPTPSSLR